MPDDSPYERLLRESLSGELRVVNAHLPMRQKTLAELLAEEYPHVVCRDGSTHLFRRRELEYLAGLLEDGDTERLRLPILIEVRTGESELVVLSPTEIEAKVVSLVLDMTLISREQGVVIYRSQLLVLRRHLRTTTQYVFPPGLTGRVASPLCGS